MGTILNDFTEHKKICADVFEKFKDKLPAELIEVWKKHGFGLFKNGFLKTINPDEYSEIVEHSYLRHDRAIPIFTTAMGDIIVWEQNRYVYLLNYRKGYAHIVSAGLDFFFEDLEDESFMNDELMWLPYPDVVIKQGIPDYNECFGYTPLLALGGEEKAENLKIVKLKEHILVRTEFMGPIQ
ncbi:T6SS immunity protein Tdi1 domain-containing protein [Metabacillus sp. JX24]|uniref:T6SS immunity protein Tdi1 domain-containing protein n=1 Tax=Metabacillus sp. JX24 TaxID=3240759 RepID=UPI00350F22A4